MSDSKRYYTHNLETDKLNIFTGGKDDWLSIPEVDRDKIKSACLWSRSINGWVSRTKGGKSRFWSIDVLIRNGFEDRGTEGARLSFAAQVADKQEKAEARAERFEDRSVVAEDNSDRLYNHAHTMADGIPFGQPILVGHHSEGRDRRFREKIHNTFGRAFKEGDKAKYYARRAEISRVSASGTQYSDPGFLGNRIKEVKAEVTVIENRLQGKYYHYSTPEPDKVTAGDREKWEDMLDELMEKLEFYEHCMNTCGKQVFNKESLAGKTMVKVRGRWEPVVKLNKTTVSVPNICYPLVEHQVKCALKYPYTQVQEAK